MKVMAFGHRQRVGKDTAAKTVISHIRQNYPKLRVCRCSFGDQIKEVSLFMYKWAGLREGIYYENHPNLKDAKLPALNKSPREIWIALGMAGQGIADQTWPEIAFADIDADLAVIPDLRRPIEIKYCRQFNGLDCKINRDSVPQSNDDCDIQLASFNDWSAEISNNGTLREFNIAVTTLFEDFWHGRVQPKTI